MSKYDLLQMCGCVTGGGALSTSLPSGATAGLMVVTTLLAYWMISSLTDSMLSVDLRSCSTSGHWGAMPHHAHEGCHDAATQIAFSSQWPLVHQGRMIPQTSVLYGRRTNQQGLGCC